MRAAPLRVLVVGALTRTGQQVVRSLAARRDDFSVTALCGREMGGSARSDAPSLRLTARGLAEACVALGAHPGHGSRAPCPPIRGTMRRPFGCSAGLVLAVCAALAQASLCG